MVRTRWRESGIGGGRKGWVGMVSLGGNRWNGLCTEWVILNEGGGRESGPRAENVVFTASLLEFSIKGKCLKKTANSLDMSLSRHLTGRL